MLALNVGLPFGGRAYGAFLVGQCSFGAPAGGGVW